LLGHVSRMPPSADAYKAIYQDIFTGWRRRPGRPWQSWLSAIHWDLLQLEVDLDSVHELAADHSLWRGLIRGALHRCGSCYWWWWWFKVPERGWVPMWILSCTKTNTIVCSATTPADYVHLPPSCVLYRGQGQGSVTDHSQLPAHESGTVCQLCCEP